MKIKIVYSVLMFTSVFFILSCDKENTPQAPISQTDIWGCYNESKWTELRISNELIGKWKWVYSVNYWTPDEGWNTESENTLIEFSNDSTLNIIVNGEPESTTKWMITPKDGELYGLALDSSITTLLHGRILICGQIVEFNNSYIDGSDNYFKRIE